MLWHFPKRPMAVLKCRYTSLTWGNMSGHFSCATETTTEQSTSVDFTWGFDITCIMCIYHVCELEQLVHMASHKCTTMVSLPLNVEYSQGLLKRLKRRGHLHVWTSLLILLQPWQSQQPKSKKEALMCIDCDCVDFLLPLQQVAGG